VKLVTGIGYFNIESDDTVTLEVLGILIDPTLPPDLYLQLETKIEEKIKHTNIYAYFNIQYPKNLILTIGGSGDFYDDEGGSVSNSVNRFNPKVGITWNVAQNTTIRAATFSTLKRTLITNQTLEPTQVAGFNQFYDDPSATKSWVYGVALDQKFGRNIFGGAEYTVRKLDVPYQDLSGATPSIRYVDWDEKVGRAYLNWTPHNWFSLSAGYSYEKFTRQEELAFGAKDVTTQRVPLGINIFHPSGLSAFWKTTYYDQEGSFEPYFNVGTFTEGSDKFWLSDAAIGYRFPKRYGMLSVGVKNLFNQSFHYFDTDPANPAIQPDRVFYARITLSI
jgi:hypothetical protein